MILSDLSILENKTFPVTIIGSGPAGISAALELDKYNIETLIIEAGGRNFSDEQESFFNGYLNNSEFPSLYSKEQGLLEEQVIDGEVIAIDLKKKS